MTSRKSPGASAGPPDSDRFDPAIRTALDAVAACASSALAIVVGGSHASGEAVWARGPAGRVCLSDLDVYVVVPDEEVRREVESRLATARPSWGSQLARHGLVAPIEISVQVPEQWVAIPARPATLELRRHGCVFSGDPSWLERLPAWTPLEVSPEEVLLLHENRAYELIAAGWLSPASDAIAALRARHATLKCALDLAAVERLRAGAWEEGTLERVRAARAARAPGAAEPPWEEALAWRRDGVVAGPLEPLWERTARAWVEEWIAMVRPGTPEGSFERVALAAARRARLRRRVRLALRDESRSGQGPSLAARLRSALRGTPQHRLNASAGAFLLVDHLRRAGGAAAAESLRARRARLLATLGAVVSAAEDAVLAARLVTTWDRWVLDGLRSRP